jgi:hypothetical protein
VVAAIINQVNPETWELLKTITAPTPDHRRLTRKPHPQDQLEAAASRIPTGELITIPAGHRIYKTRPTEFKETVLTWLRSQGPARQVPGQPWARRYPPVPVVGRVEGAARPGRAGLAICQRGAVPVAGADRSGKAGMLAGGWLAWSAG